MTTAAARWVARIDRISERIGRTISWLVVLMILVGAFNATVRYLGRFTGWNLSSNAYLEAQWYLFSVIFLLGGAYALERGAHVRVDVFYARLSPRGQAWINLFGTLAFLIPFACVGVFVALPSVRNAWSTWETSPDPGGLARYPIKTVLPLGFLLLLMQAAAELMRSVMVLRGVPAAEQPSEAANEAPDGPGPGFDPADPHESTKELRDG
jgi:TRAP-type mannitol/chloroaromatic compound transport system permease small subunit